MYQKETRAIEITVKPFYLEEQSEPDDSHFVFAYHIRIQNNGRDVVQLLNRYWQITDGLGRIKEVRGLGSSASSRCCGRERHSNTRAAARSTPRPGSWSAPTRWKRWTESASMWIFRHSRSTRRMRPCSSTEAAQPPAR